VLIIQFNEQKRTVRIILLASKTGECEQVIPGLPKDHPCCPFSIIKLFYDNISTATKKIYKVWEQ